MSVISRLAVSAAPIDLSNKKLLRSLLAVNTVAAAGSASTNATGLTAGKNVVTASDGAKGVILPVGELDMAVTVVNSVSGSNLLVYPASGEQINSLTATTGAFTVPGGNEATFYCDALDHWYVAAGGTEAFDDLTVTNPITYSNATGITAFATGGQASATALTEENNNVTTCATASDSVKLPAAAAGKVITVRNSGATALAVFPATGDAIASLAANLSVDIAPKGQLTFRAIDATTWHIEEFLISQAPSTQKGSLVVKAADSAGNTVTTITNASQAAARTYTVPDAGAAASFVMTEGAQTVNGVKTFGSAPLFTGGLGAGGGFSVSPRNVAIGGLVPAVSTDFTDATPVNTEVYIGEVFVPANMTVTGVAVFNGSNVTDNIKVGLADSTGAVVATSASTAGSGADAYQLVPFTAPYAAKGPATYYVLSMYAAGTSRYNAPPLGSFGASKQTGQVFATGFTTITPPTTFTANLCNIASLY